MIVLYVGYRGCLDECYIKGVYGPSFCSITRGWGVKSPEKNVLCYSLTTPESVSK